MWGLGQWAARSTHWVELGWVMGGLGWGRVGLGAFWGHFGGCFGDVEVLGPFWGHIGRFGDILSGFGAFWRLFEGILGAILGFG